MGREFPNLKVVRHPLIREKFTRIRDKRTGHREFRALLSETAELMAYELTADFPVREVDVETPLAVTTGVRLARGITLVPIIRAGLGMLEGIMRLVPQARVGHIGLYRNEETLEPVRYYNKLPKDIAETDVIVIDPMLGTGGSCSAAVTILKKAGVQRVRVLCLLVCPTGVGRMLEDHPLVTVYAAAMDDELDDRGYILPGLGDAGDRIYGTI